MAGWWRALQGAARRYPWPTNVLLYGALFSAGDALQQQLSGGPADWRQTRCVATVAVAFHANFNYVWQRLLERALPGRTPRAILAKVLCDQAFAAPVAVSAFYTGMSILQGKDDIFLDLKQKFWNTYKLIPEVLPMAPTDMWSLQCTLSRPGPLGPWLTFSWLLCGISCESLTASTMCRHQYHAGAELLPGRRSPSGGRGLPVKRELAPQIFDGKLTPPSFALTLRAKHSSKHLCLRGHPRGRRACPLRFGSVHTQAPDPASTHTSLLPPCLNCS